MEVLEIALRKVKTGGAVRSKSWVAIAATEPFSRDRALLPIPTKLRSTRIASTKLYYSASITSEIRVADAALVTISAFVSMLNCVLSAAMENEEDADL